MCVLCVRERTWMALFIFWRKSKYNAWANSTSMKPRPKWKHHIRQREIVWEMCWPIGNSLPILQRFIRWAHSPRHNYRVKLSLNFIRRSGANLMTTGQRRNHKWHTDPSQYTNEQKHWFSVQWRDCVCVLRKSMEADLCIWYEKLIFKCLGSVRFCLFVFWGKNTLLGKNAFNISNYVFLLTFYSSKNPEKKMYHSFRSTIVFNINNKKMFLKQQLAYYNDFWRIVWHWRLE